MAVTGARSRATGLTSDHQNSRAAITSATRSPLKVRFAGRAGRAGRAFRALLSVAGGYIRCLHGRVPVTNVGGETDAFAPSPRSFWIDAKPPTAPPPCPGRRRGGRWGGWGGRAGAAGHLSGRSLHLGCGERSVRHRLRRSDPDLPSPQRTLDVRTSFGVVRVYRFAGAQPTKAPLVPLPGRASASPVGPTICRACSNFAVSTPWTYSASPD
jgi:hypothetical protein